MPPLEVTMITLKNSDMKQELKSVSDNSIDLLVTDPPYLIVQGGCTKPLGGMLGNKHSELSNVKHGRVFDHNSIKFSDWLSDVYRVLKPKSHAYIFCSGRRLNELTTEALKAGFIYQNLLVWVKQNSVPNKYYMNRAEFILMLRKGGAKNINLLGSNTVLEYRNKLGNKLHPTEKPVELLKHLILNSTKENEIVLDPFVGCGSTAIACALTGRQFIGYEIDKKYYDVAMSEIEKVTTITNPILV